MDYAKAHEKFHLDTETGHVFFRETGIRAGSIDSDGYRRLRVWENGKRTQYAEHRIVWLLHTGEWPSIRIDHINRNKQDNRPINLRLCTPTQNMANSDLSRRNTIGFRGIYQTKTKWGARIKANCAKETYLGLYDTLEEALTAYQAAFQQAYGEWMALDL